MRVIKANVAAKRDHGLDIKFTNGMREFIASIDGENLTLEKIKTNNVKVSVYSMSRNCCAAYPVSVLKSGENKDDDKEIKELLETFIIMIGKEIEEVFNK
ncbi:hypothetical protein JCM1393_17340 [Clostridium carnis]